MAVGRRAMEPGRRECGRSRARRPVPGGGRCNWGDRGPGDECTPRISRSSTSSPEARAHWVDASGVSDVIIRSVLRRILAGVGFRCDRADEVSDRIADVFLSGGISVMLRVGPEWIGRPVALRFLMPWVAFGWSRKISW